LKDGKPGWRPRSASAVGSAGPLTVEGRCSRAAPPSATSRPVAPTLR
jgi:hypothetical protein